jgi:hypothetical protein
MAWVGTCTHDRLAYSSLDEFKDRHLTEFLQIIDRRPFNRILP